MSILARPSSAAFKTFARVGTRFQSRQASTKVRTEPVKATIMLLTMRTTVTSRYLEGARSCKAGEAKETRTSLVMMGFPGFPELTT